MLPICTAAALYKPLLMYSTTDFIITINYPQYLLHYAIIHYIFVELIVTCLPRDTSAICSISLELRGIGFFFNLHVGDEFNVLIVCGIW